jgi:hypothetical protein
VASTNQIATPQETALRRKLSLMMFLQIFIWGAWFELGFDYIPSLGFESWQNTLIFGAFNVGALVALFFSTQFADRKFAAEKFLCFSHVIGGAAILGLFFLQGKLGSNPGEFLTVTLDKRGETDQTAIGTIKDEGKTLVIVEGVKVDWEKISKDPKNKPAVSVVVTGVKESPTGRSLTARVSPSAPFWPFFLLMLLHSIFYVPTISITNSIAFANLKDPAREFGPVRVWGTIGWIVASWPFIFILVDWQKVPSMGDVGFRPWLEAALGTSKTGAEASAAQRYIFLVAGLASFVLAAISPLLPHTPPKPASGVEGSLAWLKAAKLLKHPFVAVLFVVTFIDAAVHQSFFYWTPTFLKSDVGIPANWVTPVMKIGQIAEILTMLILGYVLKTFGWRLTMIVGVLGHSARFAVFAFYPEKEAAILINALHGICYAFFFATVYIFVDEFFPKDVRSSAQGLFNVLILGIAPFAANALCGELGQMYKSDGKLEYRAIFSYSMGAGLVAAVLLLLFFHPPKEKLPVVHGASAEEDAPPVA